MDFKKLHNLAISDSGYIFDPATGNSFTANGTALFILNSLKDGQKSEEVAIALTDEYDVELGTAEQDTITVIELLQSNNML